VIEAIAELKDPAKYLDQIAHADFGSVQGERKDMDGLLQRGLAIDANSLVTLAILSGGLARQAISKVVELDPVNARVHLLLANAHSELQNIADAKAEFDEALRLNPNSFAAHLGLATTYARDKQSSLAQKELQIALKSRPKDPEAAYLQARMLVDEQKFEEALPFLQLALASTPVNLPHVHALLGKANAALGRIDEAVAEYQQALAADRKGMYRYQLYRVYLRAGEREKAQAMLKEIKARRTQPQ
jgi:Tfp pilus assembly protein PilF